ncbi:MBOAT family O-acyltransferase [Dysgonomonas macrotermitis]|uniref:D-alanyl-lipoteichoic acid acyltransferase DltB, MBOAT superfamily n=1 Tax=Dysgonomonas macrotermitis TaxID=1346286 RepID=A0A1M5D9C4_9BACT|nr:MBOAT family O-acyltransferase [Dysgonomonas macrotermitis]SHF63623.1 D-alanyl-lipoteichoic acid acyltransferase DltB, MBOAT superfamily [Dysgonomonas macrotermitis]
MLFNSGIFAIFFICVFFLYWFVFNRSLKWQNVFLAVCSYFFYGCWDWRFMFLLAFSTFLDYYSGLKIANSESRNLRKFWLILTVSINLGFLGIFKYYNFFIESFAELLTWFGLTPHFSTLNVILPVGISFYTFHGLSYVFDIYFGKIKPTRDPINYSLFVSFFPLLVAGPIERATHLLPQVERPRTFSYSKAVDGLKQILWGLFKKVVIADNCAELVNTIFGSHWAYSGSTLAIGAILFAIQIYGDFSGYSDIALGTARLLGFELLQNFRFPYFSRNIAEFWRRWHISLSSWFKDYLYIPLGGSREGMFKTIRNTFIIFLVSGFWHGANWTFIIWGGLNALFQLPSIIFKKNRRHLDTVAQGRLLPTVTETVQVVTTFLLASFAWIFFRAENMTVAVQYVKEMFSASLFSMPQVYSGKVFIVVAIFMLIEWCGREGKYALEKFSDSWKRPVRWVFYYAIILTILWMTGGEQQFIYFQF